MNQLVLTQDAYEKCVEELKDREGRREDITDRIATARAHGDLSENFDYHDAKDIQGRNESRIKELKHMIKSAHVAEKSSTGNVGLGSIVDVEFNGKQMTFEIVSFNLSDPGAGKISDESPIGSALMGFKEGDVVDFTTPTGMTLQYKILSVK